MSTQAIATAKEVFDLLRHDLSAIETELVRDAVSNVGAITDIADHLREGGGKRIRPSLLLLAAKSLGYRGQGMVRLGAVVEMVHTATLVHDDIIDGADTRRGRPSANTTWGNSKCVLAGDWLYMQAFHIALEERNFKVLDLLIGLTQQMVEGEFVQMEKLGRMVGEAEYYDLIYRKTACLFDVSMRLGAVLAGATEEMEEQLGEYGRNLGIAFQIVDDVLDLTATEQVLGKPVASDLREGKATLAVIHAQEHGTAHERRGDPQGTRRSQLRAHQPPGSTGNSRAARIGAVRSGFRFSVRRSRPSGDCRAAESDYKRALLWMPDFVVARDK